MPTATITDNEKDFIPFSHPVLRAHTDTGAAEDTGTGQDTQVQEQLTGEAAEEAGSQEADAGTSTHSPSQYNSPMQQISDQPGVDTTTTNTIQSTTSESSSDAGPSTPRAGTTQPTLRRSSRLTSAPGFLTSNYYVGHGLLATVVPEPTTVEEARGSPQAQMWEQAMVEELSSLHQNGTWELSELPQGRTAIKCKWVFKCKLQSDGTLERYKARLVAKGCSQKEGIDYEETFAPVMRFATFRMLIAWVAVEDLEMHQVDVKTAFLHGNLDEEIYMQQPDGFAEQGKQHLVCRLQKALYGLKQASRSWYKKLDEFLYKAGFHMSASEPCLFVRGSGDEKVLLAVYVDDQIIISKSLAQIQQVKKAMSETFQISDLGEAEYVLGISIHRDRQRKLIQLSQQRYLNTVLSRFQMQDCKGIGTPMDANQRLFRGSRLDEEKERVDRLPYQKLVGSLIYAMVNTRPDLAYVTGALSQHLQEPRVSHWKAAQRVLRYIQPTQDLQLTFQAGAGAEEGQLTGFCDADWAGDEDSRLSTSGYFFTVAGGAVVWASKKQHSVALSSVESEYVAASLCAAEGTWLSGLAAEIGFKDVKPLSIYSDSTGAANLAKNPVQHQKTKHVDIRYHYVRQKGSFWGDSSQVCQHRETASRHPH